MAPTTNKTPQSLRTVNNLSHNNQNNQGRATNRVAERDCGPSNSSGTREQHWTNISPTMHQRQHSNRSKRLRSSRNFTGTSFRPPGESLMRLAADNHHDGSNFSSAKDSASKLAQERRGQKRNSSASPSVMHDLEDTDDDDDDMSWLNTPTFSSSSRR